MPSNPKNTGNSGRGAKARKAAGRVAQKTAPKSTNPPGARLIGGSVGKDGANNRDDLLTVQSMLRNAAMILGDSRVDPGTISGLSDPEPANSPTVRAITAFQNRFLAHPDGVIEVNGRTWRELVLVIDGQPRAQTAARQEFFPFATLPATDWNNAPLCFAANRDGGARAHAGCDLYFPKGTLIHAITDGTVVRGPYYFYNGTYALEVDHGAFLARYGEVQQKTLVRERDSVAAGQPIARVGHLTKINVPSDMLHLEIYDKSTHGALTVDSATGLKAPNGRPFMRRKDLVDPAPFLNKWKKNLPGQATPTAARATPVKAPSGKIPATGFCLLVQRSRQEKRDGILYPRTVGEYRCYWEGEPIHDLEGQMVERGGPGDNSNTGVRLHHRIEAGSYPLAIQDGRRYKTYSYAASGSPLPSVALENTGKRTAILIHPCHEARGFLSSIGCLNPAAGLQDANSLINLADSRTRIIALIEFLKLKLGDTFPAKGTIPNAFIVIEGEPV